MSKRKNKKNKKRTPEQMAEIYKKQRLAMEQNQKLQEIDEKENGQTRRVVKFGKFLNELAYDSRPENPSTAHLKINKYQSPLPVSKKIMTLVEEFGKKSDMELIEQKGCFFLFANEFGLVILSDNHKKCKVPPSYINGIGLEYGESVCLEWLVSNPAIRQSGWGGKMLESLTTICDDLDLEVVLHCCNGSQFPYTIHNKNDYGYFFGSDSGSMDNQRLTKFYNKYGFDVNPMGARNFVRNNKDQSELEHLLRPNSKVLKLKFPTVFSDKVKSDAKFSFENTLKNYKKIAKVA